MADIGPDFGLARLRNFVPFDPPGASPFSAPRPVNRAKLKHLTFYFDDADTTELFTPPRGTVACAWQPIVLTAGTFLTASVGSTGIVFTGASNVSGWLHVLVNGRASTGSTTQAPVSRGTTGYIDPHRSMFLNHRSATPNTLTFGRRAVKLGLNLRFFTFVSPNASDRWTSQTTGLCPGIVAVAYEPDNPAEDVVVTLDAAGDVIFTSTAGAVDYGVLWAWSR